MTSQNPKDLQAALQRLDAAHTKSNQSGQRRFKRFPVRAEVRLWPGEPVTRPPGAVIANARDISRGGIGVLCNEPITRGQFRRLQLVEDGVTVATMPAFCRYCNKVSDGAYLIGIEFGVEACIILSLGVTAKELAEGDEAENQRAIDGSYVDPKSLET